MEDNNPIENLTLLNLRSLNYHAIISTQLICVMRPNYTGAEFAEAASKFRKRKKNPLSYCFLTFSLPLLFKVSIKCHLPSILLWWVTPQRRSPRIGTTGKDQVISEQANMVHVHRFLWSSAVNWWQACDWIYSRSTVNRNVKLMSYSFLRSLQWTLNKPEGLLVPVHTCGSATSHPPANPTHLLARLWC